MTSLSPAQRFCTAFLPESQESALKKAGSAMLCLAPALIPVALWKITTGLPFNASNLGSFFRSRYFSGGLIGHLVVIGGARELGLKALASIPQTPPPAPSVDEEAVKRAVAKLKQDPKLIGEAASKLLADEGLRGEAANKLLADAGLRSEAASTLLADEGLRGEAASTLLADEGLRDEVKGQLKEVLAEGVRRDLSTSLKPDVLMALQEDKNLLLSIIEGKRDDATFKTMVEEALNPPPPAQL